MMPSDFENGVRSNILGNYIEWRVRNQCNKELIIHWHPEKLVGPVFPWNTGKQVVNCSSQKYPSSDYREWPTWGLIRHILWGEAHSPWGVEVEQGKDHWTPFDSTAPEHLDHVSSWLTCRVSPSCVLHSVACALLLWHVYLLFHKWALHPWAEEHQF